MFDYITNKPQIKIHQILKIKMDKFLRLKRYIYKITENVV